MKSRPVALVPYTLSFEFLRDSPSRFVIRRFLFAIKTGSLYPCLITPLESLDSERHILYSGADYVQRSSLAELASLITVRATERAFRVESQSNNVQVHRMTSHAIADGTYGLA